MIDDPNVVLPLATSMNERGIAGYTHVVTNAEDQIKQNCIYEVTRNPMTSKGTLTLSKRPGVTKDSATYGNTSQAPYFLVMAPTTSPFNNVGTFTPKVFNKQGTNLCVSSDAATTTIISADATYFPAFIDTTGISGGPYFVLQARRSDLAAPVQRTFFAASVNSWTEISDGDYTALFHRGKMEHIDGFAFQMDKNNKIYNSDSNSLASWNPASFISKQIQQDYAEGLARYKNQLLAFGDHTVEIFYNAGNTVGSPLGRVAQLHEKVGLVNTSFDASGGGTHYYATTNKGLFFVGRQDGSTSSVGLFVYDGFRFEKVSTPYIDKILGEKTETTTGASSYYAISEVGISGQKGIAICFTAPGAATCNSLVFFPEWKEWFFWTSSVFSTVNCGDFFLGTSGAPNKVYSFKSTDNWQDDGTSYPWMTQFRMPSNGSTRKAMLMYGVDADTDSTANTITVEASDNDCASFYSLQPLDLTKERKVNFRGGSYTRRHIRLSATDARPKRIANFIARVE
jgi:hypothetical protein